MSLCNHELSIVCHHCSVVLSSLLLSVDNPPSHIYAHMPLVYAHELVSEYNLYIWNGSNFSSFLFVALLTTWLSLEPSYFAQLYICAGVTDTEETRMPFSQRPTSHLPIESQTLTMPLTLVWPWPYLWFWPQTSQTKLNWYPGNKISIFHEMTLTLTIWPWYSNLT